MYAIVKTGGKQYRVERGQTLLVERLPAEQGSSVALEPVMYRSDDVVFDAAGLKKVKVTAKIVGHERGEKLRVFKFKPKRGYKRRTGHRQELTRIEIADISMGAAAKPAAKSTAKPVAAKPAAAKAESGAKPVAAKPAATKAESGAKPVAAKPARAKPAAAKPERAKPAATKKPTKTSPQNDNPAAAAGGGEVQEVPDGS